MSELIDGTENEELDELDEISTISNEGIENDKSAPILYVNIIPDTEKTTTSYMNEYEYTMAIGIRIEQIERGAKPLIDITGLTNPRDIAIKELMMRKSPLILCRTINIINRVKNVEKWKVSEMSYLVI